MSELERVVLRGPPYERGHRHGERFADAVAANVELYRDRFSHEGLDLDAMREHAAAYVEHVEAESPRYAEEMLGVAEGSGVPLADVAMLNVRWEVIYPAWKDRTEAGEDDEGTSTNRPVDGCTSFGVRPSVTATGKSYMGQNWDWLSPIADTVFLMELRREDGPNALALTEAGIVGGKVGVNEHGIGLAVNGLISGNDGATEFEKPYHVRFREVLDAERFDDALRPILETDRTCSANVLVGHAAGEFVDLEAAPGLVNPVYPEDGVLTHANHFETDAVESLNEQRGPSTLYRASRLRRLLASSSPIDLGTIESALRDHFARPASICSHVDDSLPEIEHGQTNASLIVDLEERRVLGQRGPPCEGTYHEYVL